MDFGILPPEVNSGRMYAGPGSESMLAAAAAWDGVAAELSSAAVSYASVVSALLAEPWLGPAAAAMAAAATPYAEWLATAAVRAEQTAAQARAAAAAFEAAFAMTVPPPLIAANRSRLTTLVATNVFGQNSPAIAATNAEYAEMWAQDAAAMYTYDGASAAASTLTPFIRPSQGANPAGPSAQAAAVAQANAPTALAQLSSSVPQGLDNSLAGLSTPVDPLTSGSVGPASAGAAQPAASIVVPTPIGELDALALYIASVATGSLALSITNTARPWTGGLYGSAGGLEPTQGSTVGSTTDERGADPRPGGDGVPVSAGVGQAALVGALSVPHSWTTSAPEIQLAVEALPSAGFGGDPTVLDGCPAGLLSGMALASLAARGMGGAGSRGTGAAVPPQEERKSTVVVIQKPAPPGKNPL